MSDVLEVFSLTKPIWDIALRSTFAFLMLVLLIRIVPKRNAGHISPNDMLILIVVGTIGSDAITAGSYALGDLLVMVGLVLLWGYLLDFLEYYVPAFRRLMRHKQTVLIENGRFLRKNMRQEMVTEEEILSVLRREGIKSISDVSSAMLEADGEISVLKKNGKNPAFEPGSTEA